ncbi:thiamine pyrophosphate-binding protein [Synechococcus sp. BA-132 BA5]|uniref:thiamine pyrophosphate-binding protein n=1 Tax=Synechococcus sp. BA-132 BA5 TaxID=3110252 RepID=UPI002B1F87BE|nr:thiamine pyrophosphate-binding protein [Synechococcus sp. BA-132 BA5]MEA5416912.1 thiamine pyrophosphate-binding protein [Synechococcus sp. BA-132 BA5]
MKYAKVLISWLVQEGYTTCYFVAGGNIMHLLDGIRSQLRCVPVVHEVAAAIAVEYHNEVGSASDGAHDRAFALVTAGPGLTNALTGVAGAYLESRDLLLIGGQVKREDLAPPGLRQLGIQEVDGVAMAAPVCKLSQRLLEPWPRQRFLDAVRQGRRGRPGPVFLDFPLDVQAMAVPESWLESELTSEPTTEESNPDAPISSGPLLPSDLLQALRDASRPTLLLGGGLSRRFCRQHQEALAKLPFPVMTTWNAADRIPADQRNYAGRPNTWGMRYSNMLLQQSDLLLAFGTRLGLQQTGFNWQAFLPHGRVAQVDIDPAELAKPNPRVDWPICGDAHQALLELLQAELGDHTGWLQFACDIKQALPLSEPTNTTEPGYLNPYDFALDLSKVCADRDLIIPCSSGGAFTVMMQAFQQRQGQVMVTDKGLASMGYGLSGSIGAAVAAPDRRVVLVEGDGGFTQNLQELATVTANALNLKIFLFSNNGYASIRMTQKNYFGGAYLGCDVESGLGFPDWGKLFAAYGIPMMHLEDGWFGHDDFKAAFTGSTPFAFMVPIDPNQTFFPKISSRVRADGGMESNPLHRMSPDLSDIEMQRWSPFLGE